MISDQIEVVKKNIKRCGDSRTFDKNVQEEAEQLLSVKVGCLMVELIDVALWGGISEVTYKEAGEIVGQALDASMISRVAKIHIGMGLVELEKMPENPSFKIKKNEKNEETAHIPTWETAR